MSENKLPIIDRYGSPLVYSHSKLNSFDNCPRQFWHTAINGDAKQVWVQTPEKAHGNKMHKHLENALLTRAPELHPDAASDPAMAKIYKGINKSLDLLEAKFKCKSLLCPEMTLACDVKFNKSSYYTDPKQKERNLLIGKADIGLLCPENTGDAGFVYDLKTGNPAWSTPDQLRRMCLLIFINFPWINRLKAAYLWTKDGGRPEWFSYTRDADLEGMKKAVLYETGQVELCHVSGSWPAKSSGLCKRCPLKQYQCEHKR